MTKEMNLLTLFGLFALAKSNCVDPSINEFAQDDPKLIKYISENLLSPPPPFPQHVSEMDLSIEGKVISRVFLYFIFLNFDLIFIHI